MLEYLKSKMDSLMLKIIFIYGIQILMVIINFISGVYYFIVIKNALKIYNSK